MISPVSQGGPNIALITIVCGWTFLVIALLGVSLVIWFRIKTSHIGCDDYLTILALATTIALVAQTTWAIVDEGQDSHETDVSKTKFAMIVRSLLVNQTLWGVVNTLIRMSAIILIKKIFVHRDEILWLLLILSILYGLTVFLEVFLICRPMAVDWDARVSGTCGDQIVSYLVLEVLGLLLDFSIVAVPIRVIWRLQIAPTAKLPILIVFSIGILVFIITGLRIQALRMVNAEDFIYSKGYLGLLSALGASLGITFCCAPSMVGVYRFMRRTYVRRASRVVQSDVEIAATVLDNPSFVPRPMIDDGAIQTHGRSARWSLDDCVIDVASPPYGGVKRHRTF